MDGTFLQNPFLMVIVAATVVLIVFMVITNKTRYSRTTLNHLLSSHTHPFLLARFHKYFSRNPRYLKKELEAAKEAKKKLEEIKNTGEKGEFKRTLFPDSDCPDSNSFSLKLLLFLNIEVVPVNHGKKQLRKIKNKIRNSLEHDDLESEKKNILHLLDLLEELGFDMDECHLCCWYLFSPFRLLCAHIRRFQDMMKDTTVNGPVVKIPDQDELYLKRDILTHNNKQVAERNLHDSFKNLKFGQILFLHGKHKVGKTQLAINLARSFKDNFRNIFWFDASSEGNLDRCFKEYFNMITGKSSVDYGTNVIISTVLTASIPSLFIFDNLNVQDKKFAPYLPPEYTLKSSSNQPLGNTVIVTSSLSKKKKTRFNVVVYTVADFTKKEVENFLKLHWTILGKGDKKSKRVGQIDTREGQRFIEEHLNPEKLNKATVYLRNDLTLDLEEYMNDHYENKY